MEGGVNMNVPCVSSAQMGEVDRRAVEEFHLSVDQLMENAARSGADFLRIQLGALKGKRVLCFAGKGNNGGDVIALARHCANSGADAVVILACDDESCLKPHVRRQLEAARSAGVRSMGAGEWWSRGESLEGDVVVDGLLGYRVQGDPRGAYRDMIAWINRSGISTMAFDIPSGLHPDTGILFSPTVKADWTLTLALPKEGFLSPSAETVVGSLWLADISISPALYRQMGVFVSPDIFSTRSLVPLKRAGGVLVAAEP